jgi:hypothetical protein
MEDRARRVEMPDLVVQEDSAETPVLSTRPLLMVISTNIDSSPTVGKEGREERVVAVGSVVMEEEEGGAAMALLAVVTSAKEGPQATAAAGVTAALVAMVAQVEQEEPAE